MRTEEHPQDDAALEAALAAPLEAIDRATLALHLSHHIALIGDLIAAESAWNGLWVAVALLEAANVTIKQSAA